MAPSSPSGQASPACRSLLLLQPPSPFCNPPPSNRPSTAHTYTQHSRAGISCPSKLPKCILVLLHTCAHIFPCEVIYSEASELPSASTSVPVIGSKAICTPASALRAREISSTALAGSGSYLQRCQCVLNAPFQPPECSSVTHFAHRDISSLLIPICAPLIIINELSALDS